MRKILCDRCGAEIPLTSKIGYVAVNWRAPSDESLMYENRYEGYDFCEQCMEDIIEVIDSICAHSEVTEEKKETPEELARKFVNAMKEEYASEPEEPGPYTEEEKEPLAVEGEPETVEAAVEEEPEEDDEEDENALWEDEEKPEPKPEKKPVRKKGVNYARLRSMIRDGMSNETIAENLGLTMKQFYYARKRAEQLYIAGRI